MSYRRLSTIMDMLFCHTSIMCTRVCTAQTPEKTWENLSFFTGHGSLELSILQSAATNYLCVENLVTKDRSGSSVWAGLFFLFLLLVCLLAGMHLGFWNSAAILNNENILWMKANYTINPLEKRLLALLFWIFLNLREINIFVQTAFPFLKCYL